jgi:hypothetical protein
MTRARGNPGVSGVEAGALKHRQMSATCHNLSFRELPLFELLIPLFALYS